ncbi:MAG: PBP1A family penicillin-binding protein [Myxococcales bacterium]|nr:PBP1A family penicillin-binding protein [Myxococcales bacterium]
MRYYAFGALILGFLAVVAGHQLFRTYAAGLPDLTQIEAYETSAPGVTRIYAGDGSLLAELAREHRSYAGIDDIPEDLIHAFMAAEDRRFYEHGGLDWRGLARATLANIRSGTVVQGGSTITQQVAKGFLSEDRTLERKLREAILSLRLESRLGKARILEIYLNKIFLGHGAYGVAAAASRYFGKRLDELTLAECALIAGLARAPSRYSPVASPERALQRRGVVLQAMVDAGYISEAKRDEAQAEPIHLAEARDVFRLRAPYYAEHVRRQVIERFGEEVVLSGGLQIETPAEIEMGELAHRMIGRHVRRLDRRQGWRGPLAHLPGEGEQEGLLGRVREEYGASPFTDDPTRWRLGLVSAVDRAKASVRVGDQEALLLLKHMAWAARYDRNSGLNDQTIDRVNRALEVGDVIWVRPVRSKKAAAGAAAAATAAAEPSEDAEAESSAPLETDAQSGAVIVELGQPPRDEAALYTFDHQRGYVTAMEGGSDYDRSQYNRTTQACRQPGSVFKAIYYALALDGDHWTMASVLEDKPYEPEPGEAWNPQNIGQTLDGKVLLRTALIRSLNLPSIRLFQSLGADNVVAWARRLGFTTELIADRALSLGASCVRTDELSRAFGIYARGGTWVDPLYVRRITDKTGALVLDNRAPDDPVMDVAGRLDRMASVALDPPRQVIDPRTAFLITRLLREVVTAGIGSRAQRVGVPVAGKSGTASKKENTTDTWFVAFTSRYVTSAWMGDDTYERSMGAEDASYTTATPLWTEYMTPVAAGVPHEQLPIHRPPGITSRNADARTGGEPVAGQPSAVLYFKE